MRTLYTKPIVIQLLPSYLLLGLLLAITIVSNVILLTSPVAVMVKLTFFVLITVSSLYFIARDALLIMPHSWVKFEVDAKGGLTLVNKNQQRFVPQLSTSSFVHEHCVILNFKCQGFNCTLPPVLLFNNTDNVAALRRLRVWLRLYKNKRAKQTYPQLTQLTNTHATTA